VSNYDTNIANLARVAVALGDILESVVFVGGCTTVLLVDEAAHFGVRQTDDVDVVVNVTSYIEYQSLSRRLREKRFREDIEGPLCRWLLPSSSLKLDVMPVDKRVLGFSNQWYGDVLKNSIQKQLPNNLSIRHITPALFLATKFEAFNDRGKGDYFSHDLEDIVFIL